MKAKSSDKNSISIWCFSKNAFSECFSVIWRDQRGKKIQFSVIFDVIEFAPLFGTTSWQSIIELRKIFHAFEISRSAHKLICKIEKFMLIESAPKCDCGWFFFFTVYANPAHANCRESRIHHEFASIIGDDALLFMMSSIPTGGHEAQPQAHRCRKRNNFISLFFVVVMFKLSRQTQFSLQTVHNLALGVEENWIINIFCCSVG